MQQRNIPWLLPLDVQTVRMYDFKLEGGGWFKEGFRKLLSLEWIISRITWLRNQLQKHKANKDNTGKTIGCLHQFTNIKLKLKSLMDREIEHTDLYWFTLNQELHPVFPETTWKSTKQSTLDYLQHHQRSDLDPLKTHTSFGSSQHH